MFKSYQASAGSGKTTHLVAEYLAICFNSINRHGFKHILAITFTNNATAEMKERIVSTLSHFAFTEDYSSLSNSHKAILKMTLDNLGDSEKWDYQTIQSSATMLLKEILYNYNDFSISTIDSFFQRITRGFAIELGLKLDFKLEIDQREFYNQAIDLLLSKISKQEYKNRFSLSRQIMNIVDHNIANSGKSKLEKELRDFLDIMHKEEAYYPLKSLQHVDRQIFKRYCVDLVAKREQAKKKLLEIAKQGDDLFKNSGLDHTAFDGKSKGVYFWFEKVLKQPEEPLAASMGKAKAKESCLHKDTLKNGAISFPDELVFELAEKVAIAQECYLELKILAENINTFSLIFDLQEILNDIKVHDNLFFLCDTNTLVNEEIKDNDTPFIFEKIGNRYNNFLVDEFQDTSKMQWENLLPLVKNAVSGGYSQPGKSILFGDTKQAIYRFRSGEVSLFQNLSTEEGYKKAMGWQTDEPVDFHREALNTNYRSANAIVDFNNKFFSFLKEITHKETPVFAKAAIYYNDLEQLNPEGTVKEGFVSVRFKDDNDGEDYLENEVLDAVRNAVARGFDYQDIAILSRGVDKSAKYARHLSENGYPVISSDSLLLNASEEVRVIIASLQYLLEPKHEIAQAVILTYLGRHLDINYSTDNLLFLLKTKPFLQILNELSFNFNNKKLLDLPLYSLIKELMQLFGFRSANAYITTFLDKVLHFVSTKNPSISTFLDWWEEKKETLSLSSPKNLNAITVTTIHKSKGLQYPVVIFPFTRYNSFLTKETAWLKMEDNEILPYFPIKISSGLKGTALENIYTEEYDMSRLDDLNTLYVAHTRPVSCLYIITEKKNGHNYAKFLAKFIEENSTETQEEVSHYYFGQEDFFVKKDKIQEKEEAIRPLPIANFSPNEEQLLYTKIVNENEQQVLGIAIHDYLAKLKDFPQSKSEIDQLIINLDEDSVQRIKSALETILNDETISPFFSPEATSLREVSIMTGDGQLFRPDRIAILNGQVLVVDYKTGIEKTRDHQQLQHYVELVQEMGYQNVKGKLIYI
ncbi:UvrD-helicase domain-containing protein [Bacteroidales bacterium OttesenSCG-928-B11]|nr:UvrD-helicase domain-containing protein [Bacteroidales bacterium OttesenSCG-928-B11]MDL2325448.1 UvrD-helicase domain-containing protein [Bacteroidales bacterium OttesenSCG-928-A14]